MSIPLLLSLSESARLFGVSQRTLRRTIGNGDIPHSIVQGRYKFLFTDLLNWSNASTRTRQKRDADGIGQYVAVWKSVEEVTAKNAFLTESKPQVFQPASRAKKRAQKPVPAPTSAQKPPDEEPILNWD